jgi:hypothetical protein
MPLQTPTRPHATRQWHRRQKTTALGMAIWPNLALAVVRQKEKPMPQGRQLGACNWQSIIAIECGTQCTQRRWRDEIF